MTIRTTKNLSAFFALLLFAMPVHATTEPPINSLFFTPDETKQIEALANKGVPGAAHADIHLGAVMYYGPGEWTLWLQGERWTPLTEHADLRILDVSADEVHLALIDAPDASPHEITLRPHQTYQVATGKIVEGGP